MRLLSVRVRDFRCIEDSTNFPIADVTCLVGKNESGKTALLKALHKLKPDEASKEKFEPSKDYPRRKWRPDAPIPTSPPAIDTEWRLDDSEITRLETQFGPGIVPNRTLTASKSYDNVRRFGIQVNEDAAVKNLAGELNIPEEDLSSGGSKNHANLQKSLADLKERTATQQKLLDALKQRFPQGI
jgi:ATPase subunit of ABC transporter with duplicated ATPase domains